MDTYNPDKVQIKELTFEPYIEKHSIDRRVGQIGKRLSHQFEGTTPILVGVLNGAFMFLSDLIRNMSIPCEIDFWKLSSYGDDQVSSGQISELKSLDANIEDRHVVLVEDIVDTGMSMNYMLKQLEASSPKEITTVTLLHKKEAMRYEVSLDYVGFEIPDYFVVGYGLDYAQQGRNLPHIYIKKEK